jgi:hypothetical protein
LGCRGAGQPHSDPLLAPDSLSLLLLEPPQLFTLKHFVLYLPLGGPSGSSLALQAGREEGGLMVAGCVCVLER